LRETAQHESPDMLLVTDTLHRVFQAN
jgi:hypothetical protein